MVQRRNKERVSAVPRPPKTNSSAKLTLLKMRMLCESQNRYVERIIIIVVILLLEAAS